MLRKDLNHSPTADGGIQTSDQIRASRNDLKYPPTTVGWYSDFLRKALPALSTFLPSGFRLPQLILADHFSFS
jgi:hypothetical protein